MKRQILRRLGAGLAAGASFALALNLTEMLIEMYDRDTISMRLATLAIARRGAEREPSPAEISAVHQAAREATLIGAIEWTNRTQREDTR